MGDLLKLIIVVGLVVGIYRYYVQKAIVFEYERGLFFVNGTLRRTLSAGRYRYLRFRSLIQRIDIRLRSLTIPAQEIITADNVTIKITLAAQYFVADPALAVTRVEKFSDALYMTLQLALREMVGAARIEELLERRSAIGKTIQDQTEAELKEIGLTVKKVDIKDVTFPGELKKIFARVVEAQKEGLALLEKARGETAALRNLANAARMLEGNPNLLQLRLFQSLDGGKGNSVVLGWPPVMAPLPIKGVGRSTEGGSQPPGTADQ
ncbi:MAG: slipin family protein [bacterium]|nr:slipin family protein [bacterium]